MRCQWAEGDQLLVQYHDEEWGIPQHDERALFELLTLEGAQAGLSWLTILRRREGYRAAFAGFDVSAVAAFDEDDEARLLADPGIIRNRAKIRSTIQNAQATIALQDDGLSLDQLLWSFVEGEPIVGGFVSVAELPAETAESKRMSKELKRRGFSFVGPTICYALMQAAGLVNDHVKSCFRYQPV